MLRNGLQQIDRRHARHLLTSAGSATHDMKCQHCEKPAVFHITELTGPQPVEHHLCETCAKDYLQEGDPATPPAPTLAPLATRSVAASATPVEATEPAPALVFEEEADPPTGTPLPKGTFYYFWEPA